MLDSGSKPLTLYIGDCESSDCVHTSPHRNAQLPQDDTHAAFESAGTEPVVDDVSVLLLVETELTGDFGRRGAGRHSVVAPVGVFAFSHQYCAKFCH